MTVVARAFRGGDYLTMVVRSDSGDELWSSMRSQAFSVLVVVLDAANEPPTFNHYDTLVQLSGATQVVLATQDGAESVIALPWPSAYIRTKLVPYCLGLDGSALEVIEVAPCLPDPRSRPIVRWAAGVSVSPLGFFLGDVQAITKYAAGLPRGNILDRLTSSEDGDKLLEMGAIVPVLGVPAWTYVLVEIDPSAIFDARLGATCLAPRAFPISAPAHVFDGQALQNWNPAAGWKLPLSTSAWFELSATSAAVQGGTALITWRLRATEPGAKPGEPIINPNFDDPS